VQSLLRLLDYTKAQGRIPIEDVSTSSPRPGTDDLSSGKRKQSNWLVSNCVVRRASFIFGSLLHLITSRVDNMQILCNLIALLCVRQSIGVTESSFRGPATLIQLLSFNRDANYQAFDCQLGRLLGILLESLLWLAQVIQLAIQVDSVVLKNHGVESRRHPTIWVASSRDIGVKNILWLAANQ
jgi:hypothetical protein